MAESGFSLKDELFNAATIGDLAAGFAAAGVLEAAPFEKEVLARLPELELKQRINWIADVLERFLPQEFGDMTTALLAGLPPPLDPSLSDDDFGRFIYAPLGVLVERHGMAQPELALDALAEITQRFSMEFSIRAFLTHHRALTLARMARWARHPHYHVRRLVSEGTRPRLPWGTKVDLGMDETLPLLDMLHADPTRYVTRSVANHLNDISKTHPDLVLERLRHWQAEGRQRPVELDWMIRHALRSRIKAGDPQALALLGYDPDPQVSVARLSVNPEVAIGSALELEVLLRADRPQNLIVNYEIEFVAARGTRRKVFRLKDVAVQKGDTTLAKRHPMKGGATTFTLLPGAHRLTLLVNGRRMGEAEFALTEQV